jgi:hypothetical protein
MHRRSHRKSRAGCKECKQRHIKCDENQPSCTKCFDSQLQCSYLLWRIDRASWLRQRSGQRPKITDLTRSPDAISDLAVARATTSAYPVNYCIQSYALSHLELLNHFENSFVQTASMGAEFGVIFFKIALREAFRASYLMDQIIALSAAHRSTNILLEPGQQDFYRSEALKCQTRALANFQGMYDNIRAENCLPTFLFSSLLGQQALFDALSFRGEFTTMIELFAQCFCLYRGIRVIADHSWPLIRAQFESELGKAYPVHYHNQIPQKPKPHNHFFILLQLISQSELDNRTKRACREAIFSLYRKYEAQLSVPNNPFRRAEIVHEWAVHVLPEYVNLLRQRRPEAIIILGTYAVLIHNAREYWSYGDSGCFLMRAISSYLGGRWSKWLAWPREVLAVTYPRS